jgi:mono/diheme cytochrome c family protein
VARPKLNLAGGGIAAVAVALALVPALSGCGVSSKGDYNRGKQLFAAVCAQCHTLRDAGSSSTQGPDLDAAFSQARASGMDHETIAGVVKNQVENPRPPQPGEPNPYVTMPADLLKGQDLDDVASYIGTVAGNPEFKGPQLPDDPGALVFLQNGCAGCHTLAAAGSTGTVGPDLDQALPKQSAAMIKESIVDPDKKKTPGYPLGVMPSDFEQRIGSQQLDQLVSFLKKCAGNASNAACQPSGGKKKAG